MGLDQYLHRKIYVGANYAHNDVTGTIDIIKGGERLPITLNKVIYVFEDAMYWRKANAIHSWFVNNVQDGEDDCNSHDVSLEQLEKLLDTVKQVLDNHNLAVPFLPTQEGFFFGHTEYDEWYFNDLEDTKVALQEIVDNPDNRKYGIEFTYESSW